MRSASCCGLALEVGSRGLGGLDDRGDLLAGHAGDRLGAAALRLALERLDLVGQPGEVLVDGLGLIATAADGEVALLDGLAVQGHAGQPNGPSLQGSRTASPSRTTRPSRSSPASARSMRPAARPGSGACATSAATTRPRT